MPRKLMQLSSTWQILKHSILTIIEQHLTPLLFLHYF